MAIEEEEVPGIPEWVVTFGDMMSLLLTFFIMLVSMSEIKKEELYQAMVESMRQRFGHDATIAAIVPGSSKPRNAALKNLATMGRAKRAHTMKGGDKVRAPVGDNPRVRTIRRGDQPTGGGVVYFGHGQADLTDENKTQLQIVAQQIGGKPHKIEVRGHASRKPLDDSPQYRDHWHLAFDRSRKTMKFLAELGIDPNRIRLVAVADNEPVYVGIDPNAFKKNDRVEVLLLNEHVSDFVESEDKPP